MTWLKPTIQLARLVVLKDGQRAYDEHFHKGVNIIRGVHGEGNSVGKSTIAELIFFALGGDLIKFKDEARLCNFTIAEVLINNIKITLRREIVEATMQPMWLYFGDFDASQRSGSEGWQKYPYKRYGDRESFTQVLFRLMNMPEVPAEAEANITIHQLLRLMYVDQMTPVDRIFRLEARDSAQRRQAVGDLLCGAYDERIYPAQILLRDKEKEYDLALQQYTSLIRVLTASGEGFNVDFIEARKRNVEHEIAEANDKLNILRNVRFNQDQQDREKSGVISAIKSDLDKFNRDIIDNEQREAQLAFGIEDSALLIEDIERTLQYLKQGEVTATTIGPISFTFCPSCFTPLKGAADGHTCQLCHSPLDDRGEKSRIARMRNELEVQLKESQQLQDNREKDIVLVRRKLAKMRTMRNAISADYIRLNRDYLTEADAEISRLTGRLGYLERELVEIAKETNLAEQLDQLSKSRARLNEEITLLRDRVNLWKDQRDRRQAGAYRAITQKTAAVLADDLHTEAEFTASSDVYFDFSEDRITVNGKSGFSASSLTVLRNAFHLALHWSSCEQKAFRYPRFLLMDNIEDKGMTEARSQNFQRLIVKISGEIQVDHQIIFTTSMIDPSLDIDRFTVGDKYDFNNKSLKIARPNSSDTPAEAPLV